MPARQSRKSGPGIVSAKELRRRVEVDEDRALTDRAAVDRYPERHMPIAGTEPRAEMWGTDNLPAPEGQAYADALSRYDLFSHTRERLLENYGYNTARAYWGDLDDLFYWCEKRGLDIFDLTERDMNQYKGLLRRRKYSESTIRRRTGTYRLFRSVIDAE